MKKTFGSHGAALLLLAVCAFTLPPANAKVFWNETFDTDLSAWAPSDQNLWNNNTGYPGQIERGSSFGIDGTPGLQYTYTDLNTGGGVAADRDFPLSSKHLWLRWDYKAESGFQCSTSDTKIFNLYDFGYYPNFIAGCNGGALIGSAVGSWDLSGDVVELDTGFRLPDNKWHCIEWNINYNDPGVSNGSMIMYVDGKQVGSVLNRMFTPSTSQQCPFASYATCSPDTRVKVLRLYHERGLGHTYYDNIAVGDTRIGCGTTPPGNALAAPTGLTVQ